MLNDLIDFEQKLTIDEVEEAIREEENNSFIEGKAVHLFNEVTAILDYVPVGWELDEDGKAAVSDVEDIEDFPEIEEEDTSAISKDSSLKWDEDEEDDEDDEEVYEGGPPDKDDDLVDLENEDDEEEEIEEEEDKK